MTDDIKPIDKMLLLSERQLLALVRLAIGQPILPCLEVCKIDWQKLYDLAEKQSVVGICFAGIERLQGTSTRNSETKKQETASQMPDLDLLMEWLGQSEYIKTQNEVANEGCVEVTRIFADLGYRSVILKGQSNVRVYGDLASLRTSGDIDIWIDGNRAELIRLAQRHWKTSNLQFHHVDCEIPDVPETELHFWPMTLFNYWKDKKLKRIFEEEREASFENKFSLPQGDICILTPRANVMMQLAHIYHHLMFEGIGLRQLLDYYMLLRSIDDEGVRSQLMQDIKDCGLTKFASAVSWVLQEAFAPAVSEVLVSKVSGDYDNEKQETSGQETASWMLCDPNEKEGLFLLSEIMAAGNFGHYDERYKNAHRTSKFRNFLFITYQNFRLFRHYPSDCIWNIIYRFCQFWWRRKYI